MSESEAEGLRPTPLTSRHRSRDAVMGDFAGYDMPIHYPMGILSEHLHVRQHAGLFDISHMGQAYLMGHNAAEALERLTPSDIKGLKTGGMRYTVLLNEDGGIIDDITVLKLTEDLLFLTVNANRKEVAYGHLRRTLPRDVTLEVLPDRIFLALQGPEAEKVIKRVLPDAVSLAFMTGYKQSDGIVVTRSGYTGEDGFEISIPVDEGFQLVDELATQTGVEWIGFGARDTLRMEAGLCLYSHELSENTSPIEAGLEWIIAPRRRQAGDFPGSPRLLQEIENGPARLRVGFRPEGRIIAREGTSVLIEGKPVGLITSGGFGPSLGGPVAMGYIERSYAAPGTRVALSIRGEAHPATVFALPFVPHRYKK